MAIGTDGDNALLSILVDGDTNLVPSQHSRADNAPDRRTQTRFEPVEPVTLRLDVFGGIWSARLRDVSTRSACLQLDHEIADQIEDGQSASIWLETRQGSPLRLDGSLRLLRPRSGSDANNPVGITFTYS
ncbi:MAG: hypothetical protein KAV82_12835 [Phycisphaerae bacterium]|nr:hypothetical protein [Phycisphaerae bacterium]